MTSDTDRESPAISIASTLPCVTTLFRNNRTMMAASRIGRRMRCVLTLRRDPTSAYRTASTTTMLMVWACVRADIPWLHRWLR